MPWDHTPESNRGRGLLLAHLAALPGPHAKSRLAAAAGLSRVEFSYLVTGKRTATLRQAVALSDATAGAVPVRSWLEVDGSQDP